MFSPLYCITYAAVQRILYSPFIRFFLSHFCFQLIIHYLIKRAFSSYMEIAIQCIGELMPLSPQRASFFGMSILM